MSALDKIAELFPNRIMANIDLDQYRDDTYSPRVKSADQYKEELKKRIRQHGVYGDCTGFDMLHNVFRYRPSELTIWTGYKGHGKSAVLSQQILHLMMKEKKRVFIISPEFPAVELLYRLLHQFVGNSDANEEEGEVMLDILSACLWIYDVQSSLKPSDVPALCRWVMDKVKVDHIVIDSLMKCGIPPDDYAKQKVLVDQIQSVAHQTGAHIHLVAHARKGTSDDQPARLHDIKGASEIGDMAENVISVWRNKPKERGDKDKQGDPDALMCIEAQRNCGGWIGMLPLNYNRQAMIYHELHRDYRDHIMLKTEEQF